MRPSDIAIGLSPDARYVLQACAGGYFWRLSLDGAGVELLDAKCIWAKLADVGRGHVITPTRLGSQVAKELRKAG